ncbi:hypothetical protein FZEAL_7342 [Fusarium zealandicum]|uniref:Uncharacterized protein n=1 Tax=Fusarium zealandicum TaxID=1053134 RepID=A0A8H4UGZ8_9HYPO|nr:hypothetical protein FZEAL_7342 [Fusarium zealandicum]
MENRKFHKLHPQHQNIFSYHVKRELKEMLCPEESEDLVQDRITHLEQQISRFKASMPQSESRFRPFENRFRLFENRISQLEHRVSEENGFLGMSNSTFNWAIFLTLLVLVIHCSLKATEGSLREERRAKKRAEKQRPCSANTAEKVLSEMENPEVYANRASGGSSTTDK